MGTGKSTIGRMLSKRLGYTYVDSDHEIEAQEGRSISEIFAQEGEAVFRTMERAFIESGHSAAGCVVSCGGGLVIPEGMSGLVQDKGIVISLVASPETIHERTKGSKDRPLLNVADPLTRIREILEVRQPIYNATGIGVLTDGRTTTDIVSHILRIYQREG